MGILPTKSKRIIDRLYAHGFVLLSDQQPIVFCAVDWCEIRNGSYEAWRLALATAANTSKERVLLSSIHQHDAPVVDNDAARLLKQVGLDNELFDQAFHDRTIHRVAALLKQSLPEARPVTRIGVGKARVDRIASNRRVVSSKTGRISFSRGSSSGRVAEFAAAPVGSIDPDLKTISFWNKDQPLLAMHSYATHPMSYYGKGEVSSDFVGLARLKLQREDKTVRQIYFSGCSGDVTAGKFNNGSPESRKVLTQRLYTAMKTAWRKQKFFPLEKVSFNNEKIELPFHEKPSLKRKNLMNALNDDSLSTEKRILAAMGLASLNRVQSRLAIDLPSVDFGPVRVILFPGESFVGFQLLAQKMSNDQTVFAIGYGECWPGYIPTKSAFADGFADSWLWAGEGSEDVIRNALQKLIEQKQAD